jgi:hypothetical protein
MASLLTIRRYVVGLTADEFLKHPFIAITFTDVQPATKQHSSNDLAVKVRRRLEV